MPVTNEEIIEVLRKELADLKKRIDFLEGRVCSLEATNYGDTVFYD